MDKPRFSFKNLDQIRREQGLSINELVFGVKKQGLINFSRQAYQNYKTGSQPRVDIAAAMAYVLNCSIEDFID